MNILEMAAAKQAAFTEFMAGLGYKTITTFYSDLSIAEPFGLKAVEQTCSKIFKQWKNNVKYFTEFYMVLNGKINNFYGKNDALAGIYNKCYEAIDDYVFSNWSKEDIHYFLETTD